MNNFQKYAIAAFTVLVMCLGAASGFTADAKKAPSAAAPAAAAPAAKTADNTVIDKGWAERCPDKTKDDRQEKLRSFFPS